MPEGAQFFVDGHIELPSYEYLTKHSNFYHEGSYILFKQIYSEFGPFKYDSINLDKIKILSFVNHKLCTGFCVYIGETDAKGTSFDGVGMLLSKHLLMSIFEKEQNYGDFMEITPQHGEYVKGHTYKRVYNDINTKSAPKRNITWSEGKYVNGLLSGKVKQKDSQGTYYISTFDKGVRQGPSEEHYQNGDILEVTYYNNKKHGIGKLKHPDATIEYIFYYLAN